MCRSATMVTAKTDNTKRVMTDNFLLSSTNLKQVLNDTLLIRVTNVKIFQ